MFQSEFELVISCQAIKYKNSNLIFAFKWSIFIVVPWVYDSTKTGGVSGGDGYVHEGSIGSLLMSS